MPSLPLALPSGAGDEDERPWPCCLEGHRSPDQERLGGLRGGGAIRTDFLDGDGKAGAAVASLASISPSTHAHIHLCIHSTNTFYSFLCAHESHGLASKSQPSGAQVEVSEVGVSVHTQSRSWGVTADIQEAVKAALELNDEKEPHRGEGGAL